MGIVTADKPVVAAIDCGTHSTRLLIADADGPITRVMRITRMGEGVAATGVLGVDALARVDTTLREFRTLMDAAEVDAVRVTATAAARRASNRSLLEELAIDAVGHPLDVLAGDEEARLSVRGATARRSVDGGPFLVVDIGGGSTEVAVGDAASYLGGVSVDVGCVWATERFIHTDPPRPEELSSLLSVLSVYWEDVAREVPAIDTTRQTIGLAGTVATVAQIEIGTDDHSRVDGFVLTKAAAEDVFRTVASETADDRRHNPGLEEGRVDTIVGGTAVLVSFMRHFGVAELTCSEADILDGLIDAQLSLR